MSNDKQATHVIRESKVQGVNCWNSYYHSW